MKKALMAVSAFSAVFALLISGIVMGLEEAEAPETETVAGEQIYEYDEILDTLIEGIDVQDIGEEDAETGPVFSDIMKRSYQLLTVGFNSRNSMWGQLPPIKNIHGAEDPGKWMIEYIEEHGEEEHINVTDEDADGIPEKVIVNLRFPEVTGRTDTSSRVTDEEEGIMQMVLPEKMDADLSLYSVMKKGGYRFVYMDQDDDGNPELISLHMVLHAEIMNDIDTVTRMGYSFFWNGRAWDRDDDGDWDMEGYRTSTVFYLDRNGDGNPESRYHHISEYQRIDSIGRSGWDLIRANSLRGYLIDRNSDGSPEMTHVGMLNGLWLDRNGDGWPELIRINASVKESSDEDSDGNKEIVDRREAALGFFDRNGDKFPELVNMVNRRTRALDRDDDGFVDVIRSVSKLFTWMDRDSDGIPERVTRISEENYLRPSQGEDMTPREKVRERIEEGRNERGEDPEEMPEKERPKGPDERVNDPEVNPFDQVNNRDR